MLLLEKLLFSGYLPAENRLECAGGVWAGHVNCTAWDCGEMQFQVNTFVGRNFKLVQRNFNVIEKTCIISFF